MSVKIELDVEPMFIEELVRIVNGVGEVADSEGLFDDDIYMGLGFLLSFLSELRDKVNRAWMAQDAKRS